MAQKRLAEVMAGELFHPVGADAGRAYCPRTSLNREDGWFEVYVKKGGEWVFANHCTQISVNETSMVEVI